MPPTSGMSDGAQGGTTPEVGCAQAMMLRPPAGAGAVWDVDRAGYGNRTAAGVGRAVEDAEGFAVAAHSGPTALKRPNANDAAGLSRNLAGTYVVKRLCRAAGAEAEKGGENSGGGKPQAGKLSHTRPPLCSRRG